MSKSTVAALLGASLSMLGLAATAQETAWPERPVQVIVPGSAGGDTDFNARTVAKYFNQLTGESMVVTNMPGGGGTVGMDQVANANKDGSTIFFGHVGQLLVTEVAGLVDQSYDVTLDACCVAGIDKGAVFVSSGRSEISDLGGLIEQAKANPGEVIYGTEFGGFSHLQGLVFENLAGVKLKMVDTGTAAEKMTSLLGGRVDLSAISYGAVRDYSEQGLMHILAQPNAEPNRLLPDIPTFAASDIDFVMDKPYVIAFPKDTDPAIIAKMSDLMRQITEIPEYAEELERGFQQPVAYMDTEETRTMLSERLADWMQYSDALKAR